MTCFAAGTMIATENGDVAVEDLVPGLKILTRDNGYQMLRRVTNRHMTGRQLLDNPHLRPVRVCAGGFGQNLPERDTIVSPNTRVPLVDEKTDFLGKPREELMAVKRLVNHQEVQQIDMIGVNYVRLSFDEHQVIALNGFWSECFAPADRSFGAIGNAQRLEIFQIFPEERTLYERSLADSASSKTR